MIKIESIDALTKLIEKYNIKGTATNNYLLLDSYNQFIKNGLLYYIENQPNAYFLLDKKDFYQLYYHINEEKKLIDLVLDKPITMEILYRGESQKPKNILFYWECCGFRQHLIRDNMMATYNQIILPAEKNGDVVIKYVDTASEADFTKELIETTFDKYTGDILTDEELREFVRNNQVLCAYWKGKLSGILQFEIKNNVVWLGHIAISQEFRGKGIAKELVSEFIVHNALQPNTRYQLWVITDNTNAMTLYNKFGFVYGNKTSASMLKA